MARAIDADELEKKFGYGPNDTEEERAFNQAARKIIREMPTLTPPNETPPCYQPDGDGCAYQCYDGQDEPIDKCKECPLCYSDKQRQHTPPNEPLTLEQLREMEGHPVVIDGTWCYLEKIVDGIAYCWRWYMDFADEWPLDQYSETWLAYRRPPEGGL